MTRPEDGLKSDALRAALRDALNGKTHELEQLLMRHGGQKGRGPNQKLAAAFGVEIGRVPGSVTKLLDKLGRDDAAPNTSRVFLPVAAAHGWAHRLRAGHDVEAAWAALCELAGDERSPVRVGVLEALVDLSVHEGAADALIEHAVGWLEGDNRELTFCAAALVIEALGDERVLTVVRDHESLLRYLSTMLDMIANAPRSAARSEGRRRALTSCAHTLTAVVALVRAGGRGFSWFQAECERAEHPDVRAALSQALIKLSSSSHAPSGAVIDSLRKTLEASAKPLRDAARVRPGTGRGKRSRMTR
jgi:hypothetical protein